MIPSARLDSEIILAHTINRPKTFLHAHPDEEIDERRREIADARVRLRLDRTPIAYIIGHKEFYGRNFIVTPAVLIPRPESESIITLLDEFTSNTKPLDLGFSPRLVDIGTGSGCLGITAKLEHPELDVTLLDISEHALTVARRNAEKYKVEVTILKSNLLQNYPFRADYILANLPYVDRSWSHLSPELQYEPDLALFAEKNGLSLIFRLLESATRYLTDQGILFIEADKSQHKEIIDFAANHQLKLRTKQDLILVLSRA